MKGKEREEKRPREKVSFLPARAKLCIASLDEPEIRVLAQYNPKELQIEKQAQWLEHKSRNNQSERRQDSSNQDDLEFKAGPPRSITIELLFDGYEHGESVEPDVIALETLASIQEPEGRAHLPRRRRPHHCIITWGASKRGMRPFLCVIESLTVKYTMWDHGGMPLRATCTVKVTEAQKMDGSRKPDEKYKEERREPLWERKSPPLEEDPEAKAAAKEAQEYMEKLADKRAKLGAPNAKPE